VAACSPRLIEFHFHRALIENGFPEEFLEIVNLREQCYWAHYCGDTIPSQEEAKFVIGKVKSLIRMAVAKLDAQDLTPRPKRDIQQRRVLVLGGGPAGLAAALYCANSGVDVTLVEKEDRLASRFEGISIPEINGNDPIEVVRDLANNVNSHPHIDVIVNSKIQEFRGGAGAYHSLVLNQKTQMEQIVEHGALIVATGAVEHKPDEYGLRTMKNVITQDDFQRSLGNPDFSPNSVVMILCVGSREEPRNFCSRICCTKAIRNALALREKNAEASIYVLYRDIRTIGFRELFYRDAREKGIVFIPYDVEEKPKVTAKGEKAFVHVNDPIIDEELVLNPDYLVLSPGIVHEDVRETANIIGLQIDAHGFFIEENVKFRPFDVAVKKGVFVSGSAVRPCYFEEALASGKAVANRALAFLSRLEHSISQGIARVTEKWCSGCEVCIPLCPYSARIFDDVKAIAAVDETLCRGCGTCVAVCPGGATELRILTTKQVYRMLENAFI
jgi:heterodisulfide reductase subunit A